MSYISLKRAQQMVSVSVTETESGAFNRVVIHTVGSTSSNNKIYAIPFILDDNQVKSQVTISISGSVNGKISDGFPYNLWITNIEGDTAGLFGSPWLSSSSTFNKTISASTLLPNVVYILYIKVGTISSTDKSCYLTLDNGSFFQGVENVRLGLVNTSAVVGGIINTDSTSIGFVPPSGKETTFSGVPQTVMVISGDKRIFEILNPNGSTNPAAITYKINSGTFNNIFVNTQSTPYSFTFSLNIPDPEQQLTKYVYQAKPTAESKQNYVTSSPVLLPPKDPAHDIKTYNAVYDIDINGATPTTLDLSNVTWTINGREKTYTNGAWSNWYNASYSWTMQITKPTDSNVLMVRLAANNGTGGIQSTVLQSVNIPKTPVVPPYTPPENNLTAPEWEIVDYGDI